MVGNWCKITCTVLHIFFAQRIHSVVGSNFDLYILQVFFTSSHYKKGNNVSQIPPIKTPWYKKYSSVIMPMLIPGLMHKTRTGAFATEGEKRTSSIVFTSLDICYINKWKNLMIFCTGFEKTCCHHSTRRVVNSRIIILVFCKSSWRILFIYPCKVPVRQDICPSKTSFLYLLF